MKHGIISISPLIFFVALYLLLSFCGDGFGSVPMTICFLLSSIYAVVIMKSHSLHEKLEAYSSGAGQSNIMLMIWIFILAGAFASTASGMGCVDAMVNLTLMLLPSNTMYAGLFIASCFISMSIGTSVGTIVALTPIAVGVANSTGTDVALITAIVVGGSFFGDNLSFISDTTIAATQTQGCKMHEKFFENIRIVLPVAVITLFLYLYLGRNVVMVNDLKDINIIKIIPYIVVLTTSIFGLHVLKVLVLGIVLCGGIGIFFGDYTFTTLTAQMGKGIISMGELIIVTIMAGGMLELIKRNGGIDFIIKGVLALAKGRTGAEFCIAFIVVVVNMCTANNTVAILTVSKIARNISEKFNIPARRCASLLDTFSSTAQGLLPYGAQVLIASGLAMVNPGNIVQYLYYPMFLGVFALLNIFFFSRR